MVEYLLPKASIEGIKDSITGTVPYSWSRECREKKAVMYKKLVSEKIIPYYLEQQKSNDSQEKKAAQKLMNHLCYAIYNYNSYDGLLELVAPYADNSSSSFPIKTSVLKQYRKEKQEKADVDTQEQNQEEQPVSTKASPFAQVAAEDKSSDKQEKKDKDNGCTIL